MHCYQCHGPHWTRDCPLEPEPEEKAQASCSKWPEVSRFCPGCAIDHLWKSCPHRPQSQAKRTFNYIEVIPSPTSSENEGEVISLRVVTRVQDNKSVDQPLIDPKQEPILQECPLVENPKPKQRKRRKSKETNPQKAKEQGSSSGTDTSESGSWESIVLETPDGVRREYIVKSSTKPKPAQGGQEPEPKCKETEPKHKEGENASLRVITRAQAKAALETGEPSTPAKSKRRRKTQNQKKKEKLIESSSEKSSGKGNNQETNKEPKVGKQAVNPAIGIDENTEVSKTSSGGSVIVDKVNETLEAILKAFESRLKPDTIHTSKIARVSKPSAGKVGSLKKPLPKNHRYTNSRWKEDQDGWEEYMGATIFRTNP